MRKILTMIPAGEVYNHNCVRWYQAADVQRNIEHYHNIGDAFVHDSSLKLLSFDSVEPLSIRTCAQHDIDRYNAEYDYCFLRGSNYINESMQWDHTLAIVEKLRIPVIAFGIGAQAPSQGKLKLSEESRRVLKAIADHCTSIGVRGTYTAEVLADIGIHNVRIVGCPTAFRNNNPNMRIVVPAASGIRNVGYTLRREVSATYARDVDRYMAIQRETILALAARSRLTIMAQGEIEEKKIFFGTEQQRAEAFRQLTEQGWFRSEEDPLAELYRTRLFYSDVVADYDYAARKQDLVIGYRLHGNLISLANGVPAVYFTYDSRTAEFVNTFSIPHFDVFGDRPFVLEEYLSQQRFDRFNDSYRAVYREMCRFLTENGVTHRMIDDTPGAAVKPVPVGAETPVALERADAPAKREPVAAPAPQAAAAQAAAPEAEAAAAAAPEPSADLPAHAVEGYIDAIEARRLYGWAWCRSRPDQPVAVQVRLGERVLATVIADRLRPDLARAGAGDGRHAFDVTLEEALSTEAKAEVTAVVVCGADGPFVPLVNRTLKPAVKPEAPASAAAAAAPAASVAPAPAASAPASASAAPAPAASAAVAAVRPSREAAQPATITALRAPTSAAGQPADREVLLPALASVHRLLDEKLTTLLADVRGVVVEHAAVGRSGVHGLESRLEELRAAQDRLARQVSDLEVFQTRFDAVLAGTQSSAGHAAPAPADRALLFAVGVLALLSCGSLALGLVTVFG